MRLLSVVVLLTASGLWSGCASYAQKTAEIHETLYQGNYEKAIDKLNDYWIDEDGEIRHRKNRLLYYLDKGLMEQLTGDLDASHRAFQEADRLVEFFDAKSVSREAARWLINDATTEYGGEPFETVLIDYYQALNFMLQGDWESALVECRQVNLKLQEIDRKFGDKQNRYSDDPFIRYVMGICYEAQGEANDAYISYKNAHAAYERVGSAIGAPFIAQLPADLLRLSDHLGFEDDFEEWRSSYPEVVFRPHREYRDLGEVILIAEVGKAPYKEEANVVVPGPKGPIRLTLPEFIPRRSNVTGVTLSLNGTSDAAFPSHDITSLAIRNLEDRMGLITARLIARQTARQAAAEVARKEGGEGAQFLVNVIGLLTEKADTRSWLTLPDRIFIARTLVEPGSYDAQARLSTGGQVQFQPFSLAAGEKHVLHFRSF